MPLRCRLFADSPRVQAAALNNPTLKMGEKGDAVVRLQSALLAVGFRLPITTCDNTRPPDGIFGDETRTAVGKFQLREQLSADGIAGRDTLSRFDALLLTSERPADPPVVLFFGDFAMTTARKAAVTG
jgi:peptidoglycan hydrolase-like protein with peptidoglycan-binding domain